MATNLKKEWMTTFFYQQDLRSYYMNGILNGGFHPGIYNANMCLFTKDGSGDKSIAGIFLYIKKGSTFIFSNSYEKVTPAGSLSGAVSEKNLEETGDFLIKCLAIEDIEVPLVSWDINGDGTSYPARKNLLGDARKHEYLVVARLAYNKDADIGAQNPDFYICDINSNYKAPSGGKENFYYFPVSYPRDEALIQNVLAGERKLPDGTSALGESPLQDTISWLCCGRLEESPEAYDIPDYSSNWDTVGQFRWLRNHAFTGRGLTEYRYSLGNNGYKATPDFFIKAKVGNDLKGDPSESELFLDLKEVKAGDLIISNPLDSKALFNIGAKKAEIPASYSFKKEAADEITGEGIEKTIIDAVFLAVKSKISNEDIDLKNIFKESKENYKILSSQFEVTLNPEDNPSPNFENLEEYYKYTSSEGTTGIEIMYNSGYHSIDRIDLKNKYILPLDVSIANYERLVNIIKNKNIIPNVISHMRKAGKIDNDVHSMVPICISFRTKNKKDNTYVDFYSTDNLVNPANVLSFLDMDANTTKLNTVPIELKDVYTVLPVI